MALRYLARLQQRALVPRVPPSAGSRPVCTRGSSQLLLRVYSSINESGAAAASKGNKEPELLHRDFSKLTDEHIWQKLDKVDSIYKAAIDNLKEYASHNRCLMGSAAAAGAGLAFLNIAYKGSPNNGEIIVVSISIKASLNGEFCLPVSKI